jgi:branched-chain amino acid transport system substrate-binding protein
VIAGDEDASRGAKDGFTITLKTEGAQVYEEEVLVPPGVTDYARWLNGLKGSTVKAVFAAFSGTAAQEFVKQYTALGLKNTIPLYGPGFLTEGVALLKAQGPSAQNVYTAMNYSADLDNAANRRFAGAYQKTHQLSPTTYAMASYDAAAVLDRAIAAAGDNPTPESINTAVSKLGQIPSPRGAWQFGPKNHSPVQKWYLRQVRNDGRALANVMVQDLATVGV